MDTTNEVACPKCGGRTWDNRETKRSPTAPDYKCRDRSCDGVVWPVRGAKVAAPAKAPYVQQDRGSLPNDDATPYSQVTAQHTETPSIKSTQMYLDAMKFVIDKVVPVWDAGKVPYTAADINAATATVMIDHQRRSGR